MVFLLGELFSRMCFNALISNLDDHPRNHAILAREKGWRLSPAYDLTPTPAISRDTRLLVMVCGNRGRIAHRENLISGHARFLLSKNEAEAIVDNMVEAIRKNWYRCLRRVGANEKDCEIVSAAFVYEGFFYRNDLT
jgi:serine/threonine-protein kinase HipA